MSKKNNTDPVFSQFYAPFLDPKNGNLRASQAKSIKSLSYNMYFNRLLELCANRFKWDNLPDSIDERYLELGLMRRGGMLFYKYTEMSDTVGERYLVSQFMNSGHINHYDNPTRFRVINNGGLKNTQEYLPTNAVPIWNNYLRRDEYDVITFYSMMLSELIVTTNVNVKNMRRPRAIAMDEDSKLSMENFDRQLEEGVPVIKYNAASGLPSNVSALEIGDHHETIPALLATRGKTWNEALMMLGVAVVNQDKKERMITDEADTAKDQSLVIRNIALNSRKQAAEQINRIFGLKISVEWRSEEDEELLHSNYGFGHDQKEGDEDVNIYDETT